MSSTLEAPCLNCGAQPGEPCEHDAGCTDIDRDPWPLPEPWPIGSAVEIEMRDGWRPGRVAGYRVDLDEDFVRVDVRLGTHELVRGAHPKHVRAAA